MIKTLTASVGVPLMILLCIGMLATDVAQAQSNGNTGSVGEIALSNDTMQLRYITSGEPVGVDDGRLSGTFFLSEERDIVLSAGLAFPTNLDFGGLSIQVGPQVYAALLEDENQDVMSISLGAEARYLLNERMGLAVSGWAYYAPDILTFGSADSLQDLGARVELGLAPQVTVFGGMRWFEFDLTEGMGERTLQEEVFVGLGYQFQ
jgi:hypothetical protein